MTAKRYLVSGLGISNGGVGRLMKVLVPEAEARGYEIITLRASKSLRGFLEAGDIKGLFGESFGRLFGELLFSVRLLLIRRSDVVFIHPQAAGFNRLVRLARNNDVYFYVMDNSFFCIRSYNIDPLTESECLRCLRAPDAALAQCQPFPFALGRSKNIDLLNRLQKVAPKIRFLAQNAGQADLIRRHFGLDVKIDLVGLDTQELKGDSNFSHIPVFQGEKWDGVYHGAVHLAKGIRFFIELAANLPEYSFLVPANKKDCEIVLGQSIGLTNITFRLCTWETGLKEAVQNSKIVFNPSLWSAPIEGALIKSMYFGNLIATVATEFGYEREASENCERVIRLPRDPLYAAEVVRLKLTHYATPSNERSMSLSRVESLFSVVEDSRYAGHFSNKVVKNKQEA